MGDGYILLKPSALEMFLRNFLASRLDTESKSSCTRDDDCSEESCEDYDDVNNGRQCVDGTCVCILAFYHTAIDTGISPEQTPDFFKVMRPYSTMCAPYSTMTHINCKYSSHLMFSSLITHPLLCLMFR